MRRAESPPPSVWIVLREEPHNPVLGVFASEAEAAAFAEEVGPGFVGGVIYSEFAVGSRFDRGPGHSRFTG